MISLTLYVFYCFSICFFLFVLNMISAYGVTDQEMILIDRSGLRKTARDADV